MSIFEAHVLKSVILSYFDIAYILLHHPESSINTKTSKPLVVFQEFELMILFFRNRRWYPGM
jgi:hypothetical protein